MMLIYIFTKGRLLAMAKQKAIVLKNAFCVAFSFLLFLFASSNTCTAYSEPGDSAENPLLVKSLLDLECIIEDLKDGTDYCGKYFKLENDIYLSKGHGAIVWSFMDGIKDESKPFNGTFDGNNKSFICNIREFGESETGSIFGTIGSMGTIKNLNIKGTINNKDNSVSTIANENYGTISNCKVKASISSGKNAFAICNKNYGTVEKCTVKENISASGYCTGISHYNLGNINSCLVNIKLDNHLKAETDNTLYSAGVSIFNTGKITNTSACLDIANFSKDDLKMNYNKIAGGIVSINEGLIDTCTYLGDISSNIVGGIAGKNYSKILNSSVSSNITGDIVGGISGISYGSAEEVIKNCSCILNIQAITSANEITDLNNPGYPNSKVENCICSSTIKYINI